MTDMRIAALYVDPAGTYSKLNYVDLWPAERDARLYRGPLPVIAHPPCQRWGSLAYANYARWGGEHNRPGNDGGCFEAALEAVRQFGGVLEHPAKTRAWQHFGIERPSKYGWIKVSGGWVCEVWQSAYGHKANKATWLFYSGKTPPFELCWGRPSGTHQVGFQDQRGKAANKLVLSKKEANATPPAFRNALIRLALQA